MSNIKFSLYFSDSPISIEINPEKSIQDAKNEICSKLGIKEDKTELFLHSIGKIDMPELLECPLLVLELDENKSHQLFILNHDNPDKFHKIYCTRKLVGNQPIEQLGYKLEKNSSFICLPCYNFCRKNDKFKDGKPTIISDNQFICKCSLLNDNNCCFKEMPIFNGEENKQSKFNFIKAILDEKAINYSKIISEKKRAENLKQFNRKFNFEGSASGDLPRVQRYNNPDVKAKILSIIPKRPENISIEDYVKILLKWFKDEFFTWCNAPKCFCCDKTGPNMKNVGYSPPYDEESKYLASRVEVFDCNVCQIQTRFPRFNDCMKLIETRTGRCGEYANLFGCILNAIGLKSRFVNNFEDHVWNEFYSEKEKRWIHVDSCENAYDTPLIYEQGWGRIMTFILAYSTDGIVDVTPRYIKDWKDCKMRRSPYNEQKLREVIEPLNLSIFVSFNEEEKKGFLERQKNEQAELEDRINSSALVNENDLICRQSGSEEWRRERGEMK